PHAPPTPDHLSLHDALPILPNACAPDQCSGQLDGTACNDGNACTQTDTCQAGACVGSNPVVCSASDQCHVAGTCDTATGVCSNPDRKSTRLNSSHEWISYAV